MKPETQDMVQKVTIISLGVLGSWTLQELSLWASLIVSAVSIIYIILQSAKLIRDWYLKESSLSRIGLGDKSNGNNE
jgi:4-hydroxybenzoate polyprenyltransferase